MEAIWGLIREEAESVAKDLNIPYSTTRIDDVLLRKGHFISNMTFCTWEWGVLDKEF